MTAGDVIGAVLLFFAAAIYASLLREFGLRGQWQALKKFIEALADPLRRAVEGPPKPVVKPKAEFGAIHSYYRGAEITKAVEDIWSPIETVIRAVERECDDEARIAKSYQEKPELIYEGHPWLRFVRTGEAEHLGWSRNYKAGPSPIERSRMQNGREVVRCRNRHPLPAGATWCEPCERRVPPGPRPPGGAGGGRLLPSPDPEDLLDMMQRGLLDSGQMVPLILGADMDGRPIYDRRVPATYPKPEPTAIGGQKPTYAIVKVQSHTMREVKVTDPDSGKYLGSVGVCECGDCESEPWDDCAEYDEMEEFL